MRSLTCTIMLSMFITAPIHAEDRPIPSLPDREGFAGPFAGVSHDALIVAGGANFPDRKPWEGGKKVWHDQIFVLDRPEGTWKVAGRLPRPLGYGMSISYANRVICVGGSDASQHYREVFQLEWKDGKIHTTELPSIPVKLANANGALVGQWLYIVGGQERPDSLALRSGWRMHLSAAVPRWEAIDDYPGGGRILAMTAGMENSLLMVGGVELHIGNDQRMERRYRADGYHYTPTDGWKRIADLPTPLAAAPSPAPLNTEGVFIIGGDDGSQVGIAPDRHRGFSKKVIRFDLQSLKWVHAGEYPTPRVTVPAVKWGNRWVLPSGEVRPGIRSPEVLIFRPMIKE